MADPPSRRFVTTFEDSARWRHVVRRDGDIIISTPPKCGTTWTQAIVASLLWPNGDAPPARGQSPWVDARSQPISDLVAGLDDQQHRRYLKTHSPADALPIDPNCRYIVVYRDGEDALVSWADHRRNMRRSVVLDLNAAAAADGVEQVDPDWGGSIDDLFDEWLLICSPVRHLATWWPLRHEPFVCFVHYADLLDDLESEMRRIADFLMIDVAESQWPDVVRRCRIDAMRATAHAGGRLDRVFEGGAASFFNQGVNGRGADLLTPPQRDRYAEVVRDGLPPAAAEWLAVGSRSLTRRPEVIDAPANNGPAVSPQARRWHPIYGSLRRDPTGTIDGITDRRVEQGRDAGLFDNLPGSGKPIPDIDQQRPSGWWANRFVAAERNKVTAMQIEAELRAAMPGLWRLESEGAVVARIEELNALIDRYNRATTLKPKPQLDVADTLATWRRLRPS